MKKRGMAAVIVAAMVIGLAACGKSAGNETVAETKSETVKETTAQTEAAEETKAETKAEAADGEVIADVNGDGKIVVGYISKNLTDPFQATINNYAEEVLGKLEADGVIDEFTGLIDGQTDASVQINAAGDCISRNCDFVFILPAEAEASDPAVTQMADAGVHVIVINAATKSSEERALALCQSDDVYAGQLMAEYVNEQVPEGGAYIHCMGVIGNSAQIQRGEGIAKYINENMELAGEAACEWKGNMACDAVADAIAQYGDKLKAVICDNDDMSSAVQSYCNANGRSDIVCIGVDGNPTPLQMIANGELGATVLQDGEGQIQAGIDVMLSVINGEKVDAHQKVMVPFVLVTKENVADYR